MSHLIVTIARQYGSGGREIGEKVAALLGCKTYGKELISMAAERGNLHEASLERVDEVSAGSLLYTLAMGSNMYGLHTPAHLHTPINDRLFYLQSDLIREIAEREDAVLIGRCADYILAEHPTTLRVFIYASEEARTKRIMERHEVSEHKAADLMRKTDGRRANYYNFYTGQKWGRHESYDLAINSSLLGVEDTAKMIADFALAVKHRRSPKGE